MKKLILLAVLLTMCGTVFAQSKQEQLEAIVTQLSNKQQPPQRTDEFNYWIELAKQKHPEEGDEWYKYPALGSGDEVLAQINANNTRSEAAIAISITTADGGEMEYEVEMKYVDGRWITDDLLHSEGEMMVSAKDMAKRIATTASKPTKAATAPQAKQEPEKPVAGPVFSNAETMPVFPGGDMAIMQFIAKNMRYPEAAVAKGAEGRVMVKFVVATDGSVRNAKIIRGQDPDLNAEALRLVKSFPRFAPATMGGSPVNVWYTLPIKFTIPK